MVSNQINSIAMQNTLVTLKDKPRIKLLKSQLTFGCVGFGTAIVLLFTLLILVFAKPQLFPQDQHFVVVPLLILWTYLLRHYPGKYLAFAKDLSSGSVQSISGLSILHNKPGFRVLFPSPVQLSVSGLSFDLNHYPQIELKVGQQVEVRYLPNSNLILSVMLSEEAPSTDDSHQNIELSELELTILHLMAEGLSDKVIARQINLEPATIRTYNSTIYKKLQVKNRKQASEKALDIGLINVN